MCAYSVYYPVFSIPVAFGQMMNQNYGLPNPFYKLKTSGHQRFFLSQLSSFYYPFSFFKYNHVLPFPCYVVFEQIQRTAMILLFDWHKFNY